jgi:hypothetical protein
MRETSPVPGSGSTKPEARQLRVVLLGARTKPPIEQPDRIFAFADDPEPTSAVNADAVAERARTMKANGELREVELVLYPDPDSRDSSLSTTLENARELVDALRKKVNEEARVPFRQPDPQNPFKKTILYDLPNQRTQP